jgi:cold shock CspA family protein
MKKGILNVWFVDRRYGFIHEQRDGEIVSHFLHTANIVSGTPKTGATVIFQSVVGSKGSLAVNAEVQP